MSLRVNPRVPRVRSHLGIDIFVRGGTELKLKQIFQIHFVLEFFFLCLLCSVFIIFYSRNHSRIKLSVLTTRQYNWLFLFQD
jgi:hypothetical protein